MAYTINCVLGVPGGKTYTLSSIGPYATVKVGSMGPIVSDSGILYDLRGLGAYQVVISISTDYIDTSLQDINGKNVYLIERINELRATVYFLDSSQSEISHTNITLTQSAPSITLVISPGSSYLKIVITSVYFDVYLHNTANATYSYPKIQTYLDRTGTTSGTKTLVTILIQDSSGTELDSISLLATTWCTPVIDADTTYSSRSLSPELEVSYSMVNTLQYNQYIGFYIDEVIGTVGPTDKLYVELYQDTELLASGYLTGSEIKAGAYVVLEQSSANNSGANKIKVRLSASPQYKYTIKGHFFQQFKFNI